MKVIDEENMPNMSFDDSLIKKRLKSGFKYNLNANNTLQFNFENLLKSWEDFLNPTSYDSNYDLEHDSFFENYNPNLNNHDNNSINALYKIASNQDNNNFTNANFKYKYVCENTSIVGFNEFKIKNDCDYINDFFLRFTLYDHVTQNDFKNILELLKFTTIKITVGGSTMFYVPNLLLIYLLCNKFNNNSLKFVDVSQLKNKYSNDELQKFKYSFFENGIIHDEHYDFENNNDKYIYIPFMYDFFTYQNAIPLGALMYHGVRVFIELPNFCKHQIQKYIRCISIGKKNTYLLQNEKSIAKILHYNTYVITCVQDFGTIYNNTYFIKSKTHFTRFLYCMVTADEHNSYDQLPQLNSVLIITENEINGTNEHYIDLDNIWTETYDNIIIYCIPINPFVNMHKWLEIMNEYKPFSPKTLLLAQQHIPRDPNYSAVLNNYDPSKYLPPIVPYVGVCLYFTESQINANVRTYYLGINAQKFMQGMGGMAYSD